MTQPSPHSLDVYIGQRLRMRRKLCGLSQDALGKLLGITFQQVQKYEHGTNSLNVRRLYEFAAVLGVSPIYFLEGYSTNTAVNPPNISTQAQHLMNDILSLPIKMQNSLAVFVHELARSHAALKPKKKAD